MTDKEVGEFWRQLHGDDHPCLGCEYCDNMKAMIRKLVEERQSRYYRFKYDGVVETNLPKGVTALQQALHDYGIPEDQWQ